MDNKTLNSLDAHYEFWDKYVSDWLNKEIDTPYLPEPWWGWCDEDQPLYAVVVSYNPGKGGKLQSPDCIRCALKGKSYRDSMGCKLAEHLSDTQEWHTEKRWRPVLKAIGASENTLGEIKSVLSLELYPFHSESFKISEFEKFLKNDCKDWLNHLIGAAAEAARKVTKAPGADIDLRNKVIMRISGSVWERILNKNGVGFKSTELHISGQDKVRCFEIDKYKGVKFVCIWGRYRNNFPGTTAMQDILKYAITIKNNLK